MSTRLLFVIGSLDVGGAERHLVQLLPYLSTRDFEIAVFTLFHKGELAPSLEERGVRVVQPSFSVRLYRLPSFLRRSIGLFVAIFSFCLFLLRWRPSIVHFFLPAAYLLGGVCSLPLGKRIYLMSRRSLNNYQIKHPILAKIERLLHRRMNAVLGNSVAVINNLRAEGVNENRLGLIYNGIDWAPFENGGSRDSIRRCLGVGEDVFLMVCVANLIPYKGHADLIHALGLIKDSLPDNWIVLMVGRDSGVEVGLRRMAEEFGVGQNVLWLGERRDAIAIYQAADVGILCSHQEGFSNSVLEGMAANLAMIVTDVGGNSEAIIDGECGTVVPPKSPAALGKAILTLALDRELRLRMAASAKRRVRRYFSMEACANRYGNLYRSLLYDPNYHVQMAIDAGSVGGSN